MRSEVYCCPDIFEKPHRWGAVKSLKTGEVQQILLMKRLKCIRNTGVYRLNPKKKAILTMNDIGLVIPDSFHKREVIHQHGEQYCLLSLMD